MYLNIFDTDTVRMLMDRFNRIACKYGISESLLLSIHVNAAGNGSQWMNARGWCAYTIRGNTRADALATSLYTAALTENLFMDNPSDCAFLLSPEGQQALVDLHVDGIISHLDSL